jgi:hypothetical protein
MSKPPEQPKIYHITHVDNLPNILAQQCLLSDAAMIARGGANATIGMSTIKARRLNLPISCLESVQVGDCVPFYFCPRSVMLYLISCNNHPDLVYRGGQGPIIHLEADLHEVVAYAQAQQQPWAFSLSNAGAFYSEFRASLEHLHEINWQAVQATDFRSAAIKEGKQAEFLLHSPFPWSLVQRVGVRSHTIKDKVQDMLNRAVHRPPLELTPHWYY